MVERLNRTLKTMTMRALNNKVVPGWSDLIATSRDPNTGVATKVGQILKNYNSNYHSSIKTSPEKVVKMKKNDKEIKEIAQHIKDRAIRHGDIDQGAYKVGDFVRIKIFKPTKLGSGSGSATPIVAIARGVEPSRRLSGLALYKITFLNKTNGIK